MATTGSTEQPQDLTIHGAALVQGLLGLVAMTATPEGGQAFGVGFFLTIGAMMIVGAVGIASRERWGWAIAAVFDLLYLAAAFGALAPLSG